jgi:putative ABC transport system permease protein
MDGLVKDAAYALRSLARNPAFAAAAVLTLALGIGANTAIFSVVHAILLRPLPYPAADRIVMVWNHNTLEGIERDVTSFPNFLDWRERGEVFAGMAGYTRGGTVTLTEDGEPEQVRATSVTADFLDVFSVSPTLGRGFGPTDMDVGAPPVALLSTGLWQRRFGGDPALVGRDITLNGRARTVIGILPPSFDFPADVEIWLPLAPTGPTAESRGALWLSVVGRLQGAVPFSLAQQRMDAVAAQLEEAYPGPNTGARIKLESLHDTIVGDVRTPLLVLLVAVAIVLLIGCANVANLLLARGTVRRRELAIRAALGAGRARVARQLLTESVMLALVGGACGVFVGTWAIGAIVALAPPDLPRLDGVRIDTTVLLFALTASIVTGVLFGIAPLLQTRRDDVVSGLREAGRSIGDRTGVGRLRPALIGTEVALAFMLLVAAGLLIRSFGALTRLDPGFNTERTLTFGIALSPTRYDSPERVRMFHAELIERFDALAGVRAAGAASTLFLSRLPNMSPITLEGDAPPADDAARESVVIESATPGFLDAMGMRLVGGRDFAPSDDTAAVRVAIVNESFVRRYLPDEPAIGRRFTFGNPTSDNVVWLEIVGVIADARRSGLAEPVRPEAYMPHAQRRVANMTYVLRVQGDPFALLPVVRATVREMDPLLPVAAVSTLEQTLAASLAARRFIMLLLGAFAALAATLAAVGIYGVVSYLVVQRTREVGVRLALGADRSDVLRLVLAQSIRHVLPGVIAGAAGALLLTRLMRSQLYGVEPHDPLTFLTVPAGLLAVSALASLIPAWRAAVVQPVIALRRE